MGLCIGMGQDGILLHWARWDGEKLTGWELNETMDRILMDVHAAQSREVAQTLRRNGACATPRGVTHERTPFRRCPFPLHTIG